MKKFELINSGKGFKESKNLRGSICKTNEMPFVIIKKKGENASVAFDYINLPVQYDQIFHDSAEKLNKAYVALFNKYKGGKSEYTINGMTCCFTNILLERAKKLAEDLFDLIQGYIVSYK